MSRGGDLECFIDSSGEFSDVLNHDVPLRYGAVHDSELTNKYTFTPRKMEQDTNVPLQSETTLLLSFSSRGVIDPKPWHELGQWRKFQC